MFGVFTHPGPVGRRREVAELSIRTEQREHIAPNCVLRVCPDGNRTSQPYLSPMITETDAIPPSIQFSVSYSLSEYLSIVKEHLPVAIAEHPRSKGKPRKQPSVFDRFLIVPLASVAFAFKKRRMPVCDFTISEQGIRRVTAMGELHVPWSEVVAVHRYSQGYLVAKKNGGIPLPHRCFTSESAQLFALLVQKWRNGASET